MTWELHSGRVDPRYSATGKREQRETRCAGPSLGRAAGFYAN